MEKLGPRQLKALERRGWDSLCGSTGGSFYGALMTPDALMILVNGSILDHSAVTASLDDAPPWASYELTEERVVTVGDDAAALVYRPRATRAGQPKPFVAMMTSVYRLVGGEPRLALYQQTTIAD
jgi:hypothetical protein